jgi:hypothetical protein
MTTAPVVVLWAGISVLTPAYLVAPRQAPTPAGQSRELPSQFYMRYRAAVAKARTLDDVMAFCRADLVKEFKSAPPDQRVDLAGFKRIYGILSGVQATSGTIDGGRATLKLEGTTTDQKKVAGSASLVMENGEWKLAEQETWR